MKCAARPPGQGTLSHLYYKLQLVRFQAACLLYCGTMAIMERVSPHPLLRVGAMISSAYGTLPRMESGQ